MSYLLQNLRQFPVHLGTITIYLSGCQISGTSTIKETGTSDGSLALAGCWPQGSRLKLKGKLPPDISPEKIIYYLTQIMLLKQTITLGKLSYPNAMLSGYPLSEQQDTPELTMLFYCPENPSLLEVNDP